jgi:hypothetical protein
MNTITVQTPLVNLEKLTGKKTSEVSLEDIFSVGRSLRSYCDPEWKHFVFPF